MTQTHRPEPTVTPGPGGASLGQQTLSGARRIGVARVIAETSALVSSVVLARLIAPDEFGRTALAVFLNTLAFGVARQGVASFLVAQKAPTTRHYQAAGFVSLVAGAAGTALTLLFAETLGPTLFGERSAMFAALSSPSWLLAGAAAVPTAQLQRELSFGRLGVMQATAAIVMPAVSIALAATGVGGEALIAGALAGAATTVVFGWAYCPPSLPVWHRSETRELLDYGLPVAGSSVFYTAVRNVDYLLLAAFIPAFQVGLYMRAFALGSDYQSKISQILLQVAFPVLSRTRDRCEMRRIRARMIRVHTVVIFPLLFGLIAVAQEFVPWVYGDDWADAATYTQILALSGMIAAVGTGTGPLLMAAGRPGVLLTYNVIAFVAYAAVVLAFIPLGLTAVCLAVVGVRLLTFVSLQYFLVERTVGIPILETARDDVAAAVTAGIPQLVVTWLGMEACLRAGLPMAIAIGVPGFVGLLVNAGILRTLFPETWADFRLLVGKVSVRAPLRARLSRRLAGRRA